MSREIVCPFIEIESHMCTKWGEVKRPTDTWDEDKIDERMAATLPLPLVPATWIVGLLYAGSKEKSLLMRFRVSSMDISGGA